MLLDLKKLFDGAQQSLPFSLELDLCGFEQWGEKPFQGPVALQGEVTNRAGIVTLRYQADYKLKASCARCLEPVERVEHKEFSHTVVRKLYQEEDDDYVVVEDGILNLDQLAQDDILLELPIKMVCGPDCKGLCPQCGCNLNRESCSCKQDDWTPGSRKAFADLL